MSPCSVGLATPIRCNRDRLFRQETVRHAPGGCVPRNEILQKHLEDVAWAGYAGASPQQQQVWQSPVVLASHFLLPQRLKRLTESTWREHPWSFASTIMAGWLRWVRRQTLHNCSSTTKPLRSPSKRCLWMHSNPSMRMVAWTSSKPQSAALMPTSPIFVGAKRRCMPRLQAFGPITKFVTQGQLTVAVDGSGGTHIALPADHLLWTSALMSLTNQATLDGATSNVWVSGDATESAMAELANRKWVAKVGADSLLFGSRCETR